MNAPHFPVDTVRVTQFAAMCRDAGTFTQYVAHLKAACDVAGHSTRWYDCDSISRIKDGVKKAGLVFKGPKLALTGDLALRLATNMHSCIPERFFCMLSWVFFLRARSEASGLVRARCEADLTDRFKQIEPDGVIGIVGESLVIRLRSRKNQIAGDTVARNCVCHGQTGVSAHVPRELCPVHILWPWVQNRVERGKPLFLHSIAHSAGMWLKVALEARGVPDFEKFTLHSLRRGAAQTLLLNGGDLPTLLRAGGWRSSAFKSYLDLMGLENAVVTASLNTLLSLDGEE